MLARNGKGLDHCVDGGEARRVDLLAGEINSRLTQNSNAKQVIRADLTGDDECHADGITVHGATPILTLCARLIERGVHPDRKLLCFRGDVLALTVRSIGDGARLALNGKGTGFIKARVPVCIGSLVRSNARGGR